jgi:hypothetical protein
MINDLETCMTTKILLNCVNYLLDDTGLINIRSKDLDLPLLDKEKVYENYSFTQIITIGLPILVLTVFVSIHLLRKGNTPSRC